MVALGFVPASTRAHSMTTAVPEASSLAPGALAAASMTSPGIESVVAGNHDDALRSLPGDRRDAR
jgi:hypothetical protein